MARTVSRTMFFIISSLNLAVSVSLELTCPFRQHHFSRVAVLPIHPTHLNLLPPNTDVVHSCRGEAVAILCPYRVNDIIHTLIVARSYGQTVNALQYP